MVGTTVDIGIEMTIVIIQRVNDRLRLLCRSSIVEVHQPMAMHLGIKNGKQFSYVVDIHLRCFFTMARITKKATAATNSTIMMMLSWWLYFSITDGSAAL